MLLELCLCCQGMISQHHNYVPHTIILPLVWDIWYLDHITLWRCKIRKKRPQIITAYIVPPSSPLSSPLSLPGQRSSWQWLPVLSWTALLVNTNFDGWLGGGKCWVKWFLTWDKIYSQVVPRTERNDGRFWNWINLRFYKQFITKFWLDWGDWGPHWESTTEGGRMSTLYSAYLSRKLPSSSYPLSRYSSSSSKLPIDPMDLSTRASLRIVFGVKMGVLPFLLSSMDWSTSSMMLSLSSVV